jgi:hypothetical protein
MPTFAPAFNDLLLDFRQYGIRRAQKPYWEPETEE